MSTDPIRIRDEWVKAVNQQGGVGRWGWVVARTAGEVGSVIAGRD